MIGEGKCSPQAIRKLDIKVPYFSQSQQKNRKNSTSKAKSGLVRSQHLPPNRNRNLTTHNKTIQVIQYPRKQAAVSPFPRQPLTPSHTKLMKLRTESKSPKGRKESQGGQGVSRGQALRTQPNTCRHIEEVKDKLKALSSRAPVMLSSKFFRKETALQDMNKTLKKMAEGKPRRSKYELKMVRRLGKSQTGEIILAVSNVNCMLVAIKTFRKEKIKLQFLIDEMKIHLYCSHPHILPAYGYHIGHEEAYLVMQFGFHNLYEKILRKGPFSEQLTAKYISQILMGVEYLHRNGIIHRDLKPENVICFGEHLKITDFGWSIKTNVQRRTLCGTLDYISPEVAERAYYDNKIDCWSIGVLMYEMLTVRPPFAQGLNKCAFGTLSLPQGLSNDCCDLVRGLLRVQPEQRLSAREALEHPWVRTHKKNSLLFQRRQLKVLQGEIEELLRPI